MKIDPKRLTRLVAEGNTNRQTAAALGCSVSAVVKRRRALGLTGAKLRKKMQKEADKLVEKTAKRVLWGFHDELQAGMTSGLKDLQSDIRNMLDIHRFYKELCEETEDMALRKERIKEFFEITSLKHELWGKFLERWTFYVKNVIPFYGSTEVLKLLREYMPIERKEEIYLKVKHLEEETRQIAGFLEANNLSDDPSRTVGSRSDADHQPRKDVESGKNGDAGTGAEISEVTP